MKSYIFGAQRTRFLMQLVLLAGFFVPVSAVRADLITFQYEGELTRVDTPLEGQFSVGDSFGGTYTFESNTISVIEHYSEDEDLTDDIPDDEWEIEHFPNAINALDFSSNNYMAGAENGDIEISIYEGAESTYIAGFTEMDGLSVGGYTPQRMRIGVSDFDAELNFSSNPIHPEYNAPFYNDNHTGFMFLSFEEVGSQNFSSLRGDVFSVTLVSRISTTIVPNNQWLQIGLKTAPPVGSTVADIIGDDISAPYGSEWVVYSYDTSTNSYRQLSPTDTMLAGVGYWFIQTTGNPVTIDMPDESTDVNVRQSPACSSFEGCFEIPLQTSDSYEPQWQMIGYPFRDNGEIDKIRVVTAGIGSDCFTGCTLAQANEKYLVSEPLYHYDGTSYQQLTTAGSEPFEPWNGAWIATLPSASGQNVTLLIPATN